MSEKPVPSTEHYIHGTALQFSKKGILLLGNSGSGKSDLALRLMDKGGKLIADDQVIVKRVKDKIIASCPSSLSGLLEVRGIGIIKIASIVQTSLDLVISLSPKEKIERLPESQMYELLDVSLPYYFLDPMQASVVARLKMILSLI
jgi:serine kinase of HPr protein (carbohydrate metabolism regulator)